MTITKYRLKNNSTQKFHRNGRVVSTFDDKMEAKDKRKELNGKTDKDEEKFSTGWRVSPFEEETHATS